MLKSALTWFLPLFCVLSCVGTDTSAPAPTGTGGTSLSPAALAKIGQKVWKNECGGTVAGLTSWNAGEAFPSLGIGHFIWYPTGTTGPYEESFPGLLRHLAARGVALPQWLAQAQGCPWPNRAAFQADIDGERLSGLRTLLSNTVTIQTEFLANRFLTGTQKIVQAAPAGERGAIQAKITALSQSSGGLYSMMDYVNFKGEGVNPKERYQGQGWGLLQVLQAMPNAVSAASATGAFSQAAKTVLGRRIALAPKDESRWKAGWFNRCDSYAAPF
jgi:hypothetical protein